MKKILIFLILLPLVAKSQDEKIKGELRFGRKWSAEREAYLGKKFIIEEILGEEQLNYYSKFQIEPLLASKTTELSTIYYNSNEKNKEGLLFGFYGRFWESETSGESFSGHSFKNLDTKQALGLISKIDGILRNEASYIDNYKDVNNIYFNYEDMLFLIYRKNASILKIRIFWNGYDVEWEYNSFYRTKKKFEKALQKK